MPAPIDPAVIGTAARWLAGPDAGPRVVARARRLVECCFEFERVAAAKDELSQAVLGELERPPPVGEATTASGSLAAAAALVERLYRMERYERRAFSALTTAARAFDRASGDGLTLDALLSKISETTPGGHDQNLTQRTHAVAPAATGGRDDRPAVVMTLTKRTHRAATTRGGLATQGWQNEPTLPEIQNEMVVTNLAKRTQGLVPVEG